MKNDPNVNEGLAADLGRLGEKQAADLSKQAIAERKRQRKLERAAHWARTMSRTFKGIQGKPTRRRYVHLALVREGLVDEDAIR